MNIAIIGAGFTGMAAAWKLRRQGHTVDLYEAAPNPGGLAGGFRKKSWDWHLEYHYHHIFTSDTALRSLIEEMGLSHLLFYSEVSTETLRNDHQFKLDSPLSLLQCPQLSFLSKIRTAATLAFLRFTPLWQPLEKVAAKKFLISTMGKEAWEVLWEPLFIGKFGKKETELVNAAWFWARIHVRSKQLGYFTGGFQNLANQMCEQLVNIGVTVSFSSPALSIEESADGLSLIVQRKSKSAKSPKKDTVQYDKILVTGSEGLLQKLVPKLPKSYLKSLRNLQSTGAKTLVLELRKPFFTKDTYWLNINEKNWPLLAVVEHTNLAGRSAYNDHSILFVGKYLKPTEKQFSLSTQELISLYTPYLEKISPDFAKNIVDSWSFSAPFAQPIVSLHHSQKVPSMVTPIAGLYWASMHHVYPWDRGTNYAVDLGNQVAKLIHE